ncbi:MAG: tmoS 2 [Burkholderiaceae bacterium]|nr:tmoS 2 [Burkholderiaceae bacterium]
MFDRKSPKRYQIDYWHIVPIALLIVLALAIAYAFSRYSQAEEMIYRKAFESQVFWAQENVENRVAHLRKEAFAKGDVIVKSKVDAKIFQASAGDLLSQYPELNQVSWFDARGQWMYGMSSNEERNESMMSSHPSLHKVTRDKLLNFVDDDVQHQTIVECLMPIPTTRPNGQMILAGFLQTRAKINDLLELLLPNEFTQGHLIKLYSDGQLVYSNLSTFSDRAVFNQRIKSQQRVQMCDSNILVVVVPLAYQQPKVLYWGLLMILGLIGLSMVALVVGMLEKYQRHQTMREIKQQFQIRQAFENSLNVGVRIHAPNGYLTYVNEVFTKMVGYDAEEILHRPVHLLPYVPPEEVDNINAFRAQTLPIAEQIAQGSTQNYHRLTKFKRKDGQYITTLMRGASLFDVQGNLTGWVTSVEDVTEKIRTESELKQEFSMRRAIEDALHVGVRVHEINGRVIYANPAFYEMVGYGADEVIGTEFHDAPYYLAEEQGKLKDLIAFCIEHAQDIIVMQSSRGYFMPLKFRCKDGSIKDMMMRGGVMVDENGKISGWVTSVEDVTERKRLEDFKINETKRLETLQYLINLGEMASAIAHELNQPLSAISGYAAGLHNYLLNRSKNIDVVKVSEIAEKLKNQAERASKVTHRVQRFVKSKDLNLACMPVQPLLEQTADLMELELRQKKCQLTIHGLENSWPEVYVDISMVQHAIINIVRNSMDALIDSGAPCRKIDIEITQYSEYFICLIINDTGPGVPKEIIDSIFEPFFTTKQQGVGIGLNICRTAIESMSGHIWAKSREEGGGFYITLPILT